MKNYKSINFKFLLLFFYIVSMIIMVGNCIKTNNNKTKILKNSNKEISHEKSKLKSNKILVKSIKGKNLLLKNGIKSRVSLNKKKYSPFLRELNSVSNSSRSSTGDYLNLNRKESRGHYEGVTKTQTKYFWVEGEQPSGLPGSFVVSDSEARNIGGIE